MEGPAYSLFHGGENIRMVGNSSDIEDEEALERHKSVSTTWNVPVSLLSILFSPCNQIEKGLNDFLGDDLLELDETETSIGHSQAMYKHDDRRMDHDQQYKDHNPFYGQTNINSYSPYRKSPQIHNNNNFNGHGHVNSEELSRLKDALESKSREVEHIGSLLMVEKKRSDELEKRFKLSEAEKDRAFMQKQQFHDLLVEQKGRTAEMEDEISNLKVRKSRSFVNVTNTNKILDRPKLRI